MNKNDEIYLAYIKDLMSRPTNENGTKEILGVNLVFDGSIPCELHFGTRKFPSKYCAKELRWYNSKSLSVRGIMSDVTRWQQIADYDGQVNSNYGYLIFSKENGNQYKNALHALKRNPGTRQATMIYTRPSMHTDCIKNGRYDFVCTNAVMCELRDGVLHFVVQMRSSDAIWGLPSDLAWHQYVLKKMCDKLNVLPGTITMQLASGHIYCYMFQKVQEWMS